MLTLSFSGEPAVAGFLSEQKGAPDAGVTEGGSWGCDPLEHPLEF